MGAFASRDIKKSEYICKYSGDIVSLSYKESNGLSEYAFEYCEGPTAETTFLVCPQGNWSIGNLINHSKQKCNVKSFKYISRKGVEIMIFAMKNIKRGTQLLYDYKAGGNGEY